jgi:hypothetical protein
VNTLVTSTAERRELARRARDAFPPMGIYAIRNRSSGQVRIASSRNVPGAINRAGFELRMGSHPDKALQADWKRDPAAISFEVIELVKKRADPGFDYAAELSALEAFYRAELCAESQA